MNSSTGKCTLVCHCGRVSQRCGQYHSLLSDHNWCSKTLLSLRVLSKSTNHHNHQIIITAKKFWPKSSQSSRSSEHSSLINAIADLLPIFGPKVYVDERDDGTRNDVMKKREKRDYRSEISDFKITLREYCADLHESRYSRLLSSMADIVQEPLIS